ncbi:OLC1v1027012C1 [Oldenlandia corymbosa var. corymbosa]|uniref:OLC1v1027012C1 n=1 Tax=Oldenlandia corymbosa var. corymbosa TaxID=529605 RepID=A0AAV1C8G1_OLDCO|nr:OLC1v1027012C1 [Oldenlandia corymbosa var. corymbosa]
MEIPVAGVANSYSPVPSLFNGKYTKINSCLLPPSRMDRSWSSPIRQKRKEGVNCTKGASVSFPEEKQQQHFGDEDDDETTTITEEEVMSLGKLGDKCNEVSGGIAELLECLESEAIMGDDQGKQPTDYNRRAQIFDKSSRVFQSLKQNASSSAD